MASSSNGLLAQVSTAHLVSHLHIMAVPAMLPLLPTAMQVSFVELGIAIGVFNIVSALVQAPLGFLVDRAGARRMLLAALALGSLSFSLLAIFPTYLCLLVAMGLAGLANGVYHPADYSLLSRGIVPERMGRAFSIHTFAGFLGAALAPPLMVGAALAWEPRWSFAIAAGAGLVGLFVVGLGSPEPAKAASPTATEKAKVRARPLTTPLGTLAVLTLLFAMLSLSTGAIEKFSVSALVQGFNVTLPAANMALTVFMFASAFGVLAGGVLADRTDKHGYLAAGAFALAAVFVVIVIGLPLPPLLLALALGAIGFLTGIVAPSRDMLVRAASPAGAEGKTFGIVSTGFNVGGVIGPVLFGFLLDRGLASGVLWASVCFMVITTVIVLVQERHSAAKPALAAH
ncbi:MULTISPECIES: MFS transporter [Pseudomonadota]|uniref:MFS transporter n=1 Tax=Pseudomonadota TaxID=1224 RepID=UPI0005978256|nr:MULTISPECIES: MFS transporter [Pseudomonadota]KIL02497.1 major facilitator transporter [Stutzerimonas stutzeri]